MSNKNDRSKTIASIGGTFDRFHFGHKRYIRMAFMHADYVIIYVNSDEYSQALKKYPVQSFETRTRRLEVFLSRIGIEQNRYEIRKVNSLAELKHELVQEEIHLSVIVNEYKSMFFEINEMRSLEGKNNISIILKRRASNLSSTAIYFPSCIYSYIPIATIKKIEQNELKNLIRI